MKNPDTAARRPRSAPRAALAAALASALLAACAGSIYSLSVGSKYIETGKYRRVLCIGAESLSRITDLFTPIRFQGAMVYRKPEGARPAEAPA